MAGELDIEAAVDTPSGWLELEDEANGYTLHVDSFATRDYTKRTTSVDGIWVDGSFAARATTGNVVETVSVWVDGAGSAFAFATKMAALKAAFDQLTYGFRIRFADALETWTCPMPAEYTESLDQPYRFATQGLLRVQVQRLPAFLLEEV